jgi:hypothetical protein
MTTVSERCKCRLCPVHYVLPGLLALGVGLGLTGAEILAGFLFGPEKRRRRDS